MRKLRTVVAWFAAVLVTAVAGSVIQTQFNLAMIRRLGAPVSLTDRLETTLHDLAGFTPTYALLVAAGFLIALPVSGLLARFWPAGRMVLHGLAGGTAIVGALLVMNALLPVTMIGAARFPSGIATLALPGMLGGLLFAFWTRPWTN